MNRVFVVKLTISGIVVAQKTSRIRALGIISRIKTEFPHIQLSLTSHTIDK